MKTTKKTFSAAAAVLGAVILIYTGCSNASDGIFYSLEQEREIVNGTLLPDEITVQSISLTGLGTPAEADDFYVLAAGSVWAAAADETELGSGSDTGLKWIKFVPPTMEGVTGERLAADAAVAFDHLYAAYYSFGSAVYGLFSIPVSAIAGSAAVETEALYTPEPGWSTVAAETIPAGTRITGLFSVPGPGGTERLLMAALRYESGAQAGTPSLYLTDDGTTFTPVSLDTAGSPVIDAAFDGSAWWLLTERTLYRTTDLEAFTTETDSDFTGKLFGGLEYVPDADRLFLSTGNGYIFTKTSAGTDWIAVKIDDSDTSVVTAGDDDAVSFTDLGGYLTSRSLLFAGTAGDGYYEITGVGAGLTPEILPSPVFTETDYAYSPLSGASVTGIVTDESRSVILMGTSADGLWRNKADSSSTRTWFLE